MSASQPPSRESSRLLREVRRILWEDWDPIGGVPRDEYDGYAPGVVRMLMEGADRYRLRAHLNAISNGLKIAVPDERLNRTLDRLLALRE